VRVAIEQLHLSGTHQQGVAFVQGNFAASRLCGSLARLIDDEDEIAVTVSEEFACPPDARR